MSTLAPWLVADVEVETGVVHRSEVPLDAVVNGLWMLVRRNGTPVHVGACALPESGTDDASLLQLARELAESRSASTELPGDDENSREAIDALAISAVVCTRGRPDGLERCLGSLVAQTHKTFEILVVDNDASNASGTRELVQRINESAACEVRYVQEPTPGLSRARNAALKHARYEHLACIDDDEFADVNWLRELAKTFVSHPEAEVVTGLIVPAELVTDAQVLFEDFGGHSKGRGVKGDVLSNRNVQPLFPLPAFGAGGNMTFTKTSANRVGGFDVALGAGTITKGAEDTLFLSQHLLRDGVVVYEPRALVRHFHRRDIEGLRAQLSGYGSGLTAFYTALVLRQPLLLLRLIRLAPSALREVTSSDGARSAGIPEHFPTELLSDNRRQMLAGPGKYIVQRLRNLRIDRNRK